MAKRQRQPRHKGFKRSAREWEASIAGHIGKFIDRITIDHALKLATFGGILYFYKVLKDDPWESSIVNTVVDYALLNSKTEAGVGLAAGHIAIAAIAEAVEGYMKKRKEEYPEAFWVGPFYKGKPGQYPLF